MRYLILIIFLTGCTMTEYDHWRAYKNFTYISEKGDVWTRHDIFKPFSGDCEDFAFSLQQRIGGEVWAIFKDDGWHAALVKDGWVYDLTPERIRKEDYEGEFVEVIEYESHGTKDP